LARVSQVPVRDLRYPASAWADNDVLVSFRLDAFQHPRSVVFGEFSSFVEAPRNVVFYSRGGYPSTRICSVSRCEW
jgi:hypothetical protein